MVNSNGMVSGGGILGSSNQGAGSPLNTVQAASVDPYGTCKQHEAQTLFNNCLMGWGWRNMGVFNYLRTQPTCRAEAFYCRGVDSMIKCVNSQPVRVISNRCWSGIRGTLTKILLSFGPFHLSSCGRCLHACFARV
ncbi:uncharacterized protein [Littorina saxatilis]|uniref:uncharacterized protein n=1 Tax=Littorina saxatilis TaxID=31220 RepID=UPI0038B442C1